MAAHPTAVPPPSRFRSPAAAARPATDPPQPLQPGQWSLHATTPAGALAEQALAMVAQELGIAVDALGPDDDFFAAGGSSALGARLVHRLRSELGVAASLIDLFDAVPLDASKERLVWQVIERVDTQAIPVISEFSTLRNHRRIRACRPVISVRTTGGPVRSSAA
ncbi:acyl carrier protein [Catenulispora subtropica]|uniref:Carrier domain-containing protein n=1 Tax=Catenulispora subtropica TaxID=450798 RepID=A0ABN2R1G9_9ACTN